MHEINVLPIKLLGLYTIIIIVAGGYPDLNREPTVPHTVALPIEPYLPFYV